MLASHGYRGCAALCSLPSPVLFPCHGNTAPVYAATTPGALTPHQPAHPLSSTSSSRTRPPPSVSDAAAANAAAGAGRHSIARGFRQGKDGGGTGATECQVRGGWGGGAGAGKGQACRGAFGTQRWVKGAGHRAHLTAVLRLVAGCGVGVRLSGHWAFCDDAADEQEVSALLRWRRARMGWLYGDLLGLCSN